MVFNWLSLMNIYLYLVLCFVINSHLVLTHIAFLVRKDKMQIGFSVCHLLMSLLSTCLFLSLVFLLVRKWLWDACFSLTCLTLVIFTLCLVFSFGSFQMQWIFLCTNTGSKLCNLKILWFSQIFWFFRSRISISGVYLNVFFFSKWQWTKVILEIRLPFGVGMVGSL